MPLDLDLAPYIHANVAAALAEDLGTRPGEEDRDPDGPYAALARHDLTAQLIPEHTQSRATVITRQTMVLCGTQWFEGCFRALDANCEVRWQLREGETAKTNQ